MDIRDAYIDTENAVNSQINRLKQVMKICKKDGEETIEQHYHFAKIGNVGNVQKSVSKLRLVIHKRL